MLRCSSPAIIFRILFYGEADLIVTFFSQDAGLLRGFAHNARRSRRRFGGRLEPLAEVELSWSDASRGGLLTLQEAQMRFLHLELRRDLEVITLASYGCELVEGLCAEGEPYPEIFAMLHAFLGHLEQFPASPEVRLLLELRLLSLCGYAPRLSACCRCGAPLTAETVHVDIPGGALCPFCAKSALNGRTVSLVTLGTLFRSLQVPFTVFDGFHFGTQTLQEARLIVTPLVRHHLRFVPKSLALMGRSEP
jgi:DNA repair protein RecO (recombination protein O)